MRNQYKILSEKYTEVQLNEYFAEDSVTPEEDNSDRYPLKSDGAIIVTGI